MSHLGNDAKNHVSFSELAVWKECSWRHKLQYVDKLGAEKVLAAFSFGTAIHSACEAHLRGEPDPVAVFGKRFNEECSLALTKAKAQGITVDGFDEASVNNLITIGTRIMHDVPPYLQLALPGWEFVDAEHALYESIDHPTLGRSFNFKGYIDGIVRVPGKRGKHTFWIIDWKTTQAGWFREKRADELTKYQLMLYKNFWCKKTGTDPKDVRCAFILLKKIAKPGESCELLPVSVGEVTTGRALKVVNNMVSSVLRGLAVKNRESCKYCEFKDTQHCT